MDVNWVTLANDQQVQARAAVLVVDEMLLRPQ
jgi:hypothetical protein